LASSRSSSERLVYQLRQSPRSSFVCLKLKNNVH
jgi:hypothetical protein